MKLFVKVNETIKLSEKQTEKASFMVDLNTDVDTKKTVATLREEIKTRIPIDSAVFDVLSEKVSVDGTEATDKTKLNTLSLRHIVYDIDVQKK